MSNLYATTNCSSSSTEDPDNFSLFLHQIMLRSRSSSSSTSFSMAQKGNGMLQSFRPNICDLPAGNHGCGVHLVSGTDRISVPEASSAGRQYWSSGGGFASSQLGSGSFLQESGLNVSCSSASIGPLVNDLNDYDSESEGMAGVAEDGMAKPNAARNASKRSRAAEVHNLSEKRRRSRINEKMKALQNLIPNSNKTDKASMLDEAIEYLKQLQLQVQLLTVRNGLSLYPMSLAGVLQPNQLPEMRMGYEGNRSSDMNLGSALPLSPVAPEQASVVSLSKLNDSDHALPSVPVIQANQIPVQFLLPGTSKKSPGQQASQDLSGSSLVEEHIEAEATGSTSFNAQPSGFEENIPEGRAQLVRDHLGAKILKTMGCKNILLSSRIDGTQTGRRPLVDDSIKAEESV